MSERQYEWGDQVWLDTIKHGRCKGIVLEPIGGSDDYPLVTYLSPCEAMRLTANFPLRDISPRDDGKPKAWRLPEVGDTVEIIDKEESYYGKQFNILETDWSSCCPIKGAGGLIYSVSQIKLVRLRDDSEPPADHIADASKKVEPTHDPVNHPSHYTSHPSGVECIAITEHENFCIGNAIKYLWRAGEKGHRIEDLEKAAWYVNREIQRLKALEARDGVD